jgi:hypothetical protein
LDLLLKKFYVWQYASELLLLYFVNKLSRVPVKLSSSHNEERAETLKDNKLFWCKINEKWKENKPLMSQEKEVKNITKT